MAGHTPNAAQLAKLVTLQNLQQTAIANYNANVTAVTAAANALKVANENVKNYESFIYGGINQPNVIDGGSRDTV